MGKTLAANETTRLKHADWLGGREVAVPLKWKGKLNQSRPAAARRENRWRLVRE